MVYDYKYDWQRKDQRRANSSAPVKTYPTTNKEFASKDSNFKMLCEASYIKPTSRQASKWRNKKGIAWRNRIATL